jgi:hypothetical protein
VLIFLVSNDSSPWHDGDCLLCCVMFRGIFWWGSSMTDGIIGACGGDRDAAKGLRRCADMMTDVMFCWPLLSRGRRVSSSRGSGDR